jgi:hypothetical protein
MPIHPRLIPLFSHNYSVLRVDLISELAAPEKRGRYCLDGIEQHFTEGAVLVAFAFHLLICAPGLKHAAIHPGEHGN